MVLSPGLIGGRAPGLRHPRCKIGSSPRVRERDSMTSIGHHRGMDGTWDPVPPATVPARLRPYVASMAGYAAHGLRPGTHRGLPSTELTLILPIDAPLRWAEDAAAWAGGGAVSQWWVLGGLHTRPAVVGQDGSWAGIQIGLRPLGARALLGSPSAALPTGPWEPDGRLGGAVARVAERLAAAPTWPARYAVARGFLVELLDLHDTTGPAPRPEVAEAWRLLTAPGQAPTVAEVADRVGYSRRRLTQLVTDEVGHGPKTVARLARFTYARRLLVAGAVTGRLEVAAAAAGAGYYDQSHLVRDFHDFVGLPPSRWWAEEFPNLQAAAVADPAASTP